LGALHEWILFGLPYAIVSLTLDNWLFKEDQQRRTGEGHVYC
jgi:hypothetical protein